MTIPKYGNFYRRYKGESSQSSESRLNMDRRLNRTLRGERGRESKRGTAYLKAARAIGLTAQCSQNVWLILRRKALEVRGLR